MKDRTNRVKVSIEDICRILNIPWSDEYNYPYHPEKLALKPQGIGIGVLRASKNNLVSNRI